MARIGMRAGPFWVSSGESRGSGCGFFVAVVLGLAALGFVILHWKWILAALAVIGALVLLAAIAVGWSRRAPRQR